MKKDWTSLPAGRVNAITQTLWSAFGEDAETIIEDLAHGGEGSLLSKIVYLARHRGFPSYVSHQRASEILCYLDEDKGLATGVVLRAGPNSGMGILDVVPFSEHTLLIHKDSHILVAGPGKSILQLQHPFFELDDFVKELPIVREKPEPQYFLVRKEWGINRRSSIISSKPVHLAHMVYANLVHRLVTGQGELVGKPVAKPRGQMSSGDPYDLLVQGPGGYGGGHFRLRLEVSPRGNKPIILSTWRSS